MKVHLKLSHLPSIYVGPKQDSKENSISDSTANSSSPDILPTYDDNDDNIHNQTLSGLFRLERL